jgi:hypothetical protein
VLNNEIKVSPPKFQSGLLIIVHNAIAAVKIYWYPIKNMSKRVIGTAINNPEIFHDNP